MAAARAERQQLLRHLGSALRRPPAVRQELRRCRAGADAGGRGGRPAGPGGDGHDPGAGGRAAGGWRRRPGRAAGAGMAGAGAAGYRLRRALRPRTGRAARRALPLAAAGLRLAPRQLHRGDAAGEYARSGLADLLRQGTTGCHADAARGRGRARAVAGDRYGDCATAGPAAWRCEAQPDPGRSLARQLGDAGRRHTRDLRSGSVLLGCRGGARDDAAVRRAAAWVRPRLCAGERARRRG